MSKILAFLKHEPVAVWGTVLAALIGVLAAVGVPSHVIEVITAVASVLGIPVVRSQVTPTVATVDKQAGYGLVEVGLFLLLLAITFAVLVHTNVI